MRTRKRKSKPLARSWAACAALAAVLWTAVACGAPAAPAAAGNPRAAVAIVPPAPLSPAAPATASPAPAKTPEPAPEPPRSARFSVRVTGDIMCHLDQTKAAYLPRTGGYDFFPQMEEISPWLHGADATIGNLETPLAARSGEGAQAGTFPRFNAPHQLAANLREAGFTAVTLANNHILDQGMSGVARTIAELDEAGLAHAGAYDTQEAASGITLVQAGEGRVALLSYTQMDNGGQYRLSKQERAWALSWFSLDKAEADIAAAREQGADAVIVCVHWGSEYQRTPGRTDEKSAQALVDAGADAVIGHHPHVLQSAKLVQAKDGRSAVIAYSAGNFLSAQPYPYTQTGGLVHLSFQKDFVSGETRLTDAGFIVTYCERTRNEDGLRFFRVRPVDALLETPDSVSRSLRQKMLSAKEETAELFGPNGLPFLSR